MTQIAAQYQQVELSSRTLAVTHRETTGSMTESTSSESSGETSSETTSTSFSSSSSSSSNQARTIIKTLYESTPNQNTADRARAGPLPVDENHQEMRATGANLRLEPAQEQRLDGLASSVSGSTTSSYKRYKFGLTNHFLTMPDADAQAKSAAEYQRELNNRQHQTRKKNGRARSRRDKQQRVGGEHASVNVIGYGAQAAEVGAAARGAEQAESDDNCDLSVMAPSLPDANLLTTDEDVEDEDVVDDVVADWHNRPSHAYRTEMSSNPNLTQSSSDGDSSSKALVTKPNGLLTDTGAATFTTNGSPSAVGVHHLRRQLLPAGDAGLDAVRCNSKAHANGDSGGGGNHHDDYYLTQRAAAYLSAADLPAGLTAASAPNKDLTGHSHYSLQRRPQQQPPPPQHRDDEPDDALHHHHMKKKRKLNGDLDDCASNGLLVKFSSIMYATFLVILGCILHVSELKQKSRNSSDHIYTTVVALVGILWLVFLQGDLQRYKKYASKFILLETIFNDHQNQQQQISRNNILMGLDPTSRSTSSSSASLVNDRMSMNTEVIFKKTAYKMYQHHATSAANKQYTGGGGGHYSTRSTRSPHSVPSSILGDPLDSMSNQRPAQKAMQAPLVPAYKFLHGKMGANFYLKCGMAAFCFGHVIHEGLRFGQQVYFFATNNVACRDSAALVAHLVTPLYSFYQLFMMFKYSNLVINRHKVLARFGLMHIIGTCVTFWFRTILEEAFEDFVHKMDYFKSQNKPINHFLELSGGHFIGNNSSTLARGGNDMMPRPLHHSGVVSRIDAAGSNFGLLDWLNSLAASEPSALAALPFNASSHSLQAANTTTLQAHSQVTGQNLTLAQSALLALMSSPLSATITPQIVRHLPDSYHCAQNTLLTTKSMNALPYLYPFTIEYNLLIAATFLSLYFNIGKVGAAAKSSHTAQSCYLSCCRPTTAFNSNEPAAEPVIMSLSHHHQHQQQQHSFKANSSSGASFVGSAVHQSHPMAGGGLSKQYAASHMEQLHTVGEYKSNFVVNADCHAANKGLFLGFFVLLVTLVTIVIFFVTINKPSHLQLGIKINLVQEATLTSLILIVTLAGYRQIMRLTRNPFIKDKVTTDDVLMLIPLPFFFIHSLVSFRAETATLYTSHQHLRAPNALLMVHNGNQLHQQQAPRHHNHHHSNHHDDDHQQQPALNAAESAARVLKLETTTTTTRPVAAAAAGANPSVSGRERNSTGSQRSRPRTEFFASGVAATTNANKTRLLESSASGATTTNRRRAALDDNNNNSSTTATTTTTTTTISGATTQQPAAKIDRFKLLTIILNLAVMVEVLVQTNFIIDGLRRCSESRYLRFKKPGRELITFAILLNITYWIVATFETKSVEQYKTEIDYYGPLPYMFISHTTLPVMLFYRYHSSVCLAEIWNRAYKPAKGR